MFIGYSFGMKMGTDTHRIIAAASAEFWAPVKHRCYKTNRFNLGGLDSTMCKCVGVSLHGNGDDDGYNYFLHPCLSGIIEQCDRTKKPA